MVDDIERPVMPPEIAKAIIEVTKKLGILEKDNENAHNHYKYASIDDFISLVRKDCAEQGLAIIPDEAREPELKDMKSSTGKEIAMWNARFAFYLIHEKGSIYGPIYKTVMVIASGAQAAGSAQSYALKQLLRGLFLIPTGDADDPDDKATKNLYINNDHVSKDQKIAQLIKKKISGAKTLDDLNNAWEEATLDLEDIKGKSDVAYNHLSGAFDKNKEELENK